MSVLMRDMKMPKDCDTCKFSDINDCKLWAVMDVGEIHPECPLVELPEKHGDLIDRDALPFEYVQEVGLEGQMHCVVRSLPIKEAPAVIKAEGEG